MQTAAFIILQIPDEASTETLGITSLQCFALIDIYKNLQSRLMIPTLQMSSVGLKKSKEGIFPKHM